MMVMPPYSPDEALFKKLSKNPENAQVRVVRADADAEADSKITKPNGDAVAQSPQEMFFDIILTFLYFQSSVRKARKCHYTTENGRSKEKLHSER